MKKKPRRGLRKKLKQKNSFDYPHIFKANWCNILPKHFNVLKPRKRVRMAKIVARALSFLDFKFDLFF